MQNNCKVDFPKPKAGFHKIWRNQSRIPKQANVKERKKKEYSIKEPLIFFFKSEEQHHNNSCKK